MPKVDNWEDWDELEDKIQTVLENPFVPICQDAVVTIIPEYQIQVVMTT